MLNKNRIAIPFLTALLVGTTAIQAQQPAYGYAPYGYAHNGYNNTPWNGGWMPWNNGGNNSWMPWSNGGNNSWMPWSNNGYNGYGNNSPWSGGWMPWDNRGYNGYGNNSPWSGGGMPWNSNGNNNWGGMAGPFDTVMDGMADGDLELDFDFKLSGKANGRSNAAGSGNGYGSGYGRGYGSNQYNNYPQVAMLPAPAAAATTAAPAQDKESDLDSDKDGILIGFDMCPDSAANAVVDVFGCQADMHIVLRGVNFHTDSDKLTDTSTAILDRVATTLLSNPTIKAEVAGHTDTDGDAAYNKDLSQRRASTVLSYLASKGVNTDNMQASGYGEEQPIATNETPAGRAENRRVQLNRLGQ